MERAAASDAVGKCPACRTEYDESSIRFDKPSDEEL
jgi:CCR4-NOT transcription complex subunit 4